MAERKLCSWKPGEIISAQHLNLMTCAINANAAEIKENTQQLDQLTQSSFNAVGGLPDGRYISTLNEEFLEARRGVIIDGWDYKVESADEEGVYVRTSGIENALNGDYPDSSCWIKLGKSTDALTKEIVQTIETDEFGKVKGYCISLMNSLPNDGNTLWSGMVAECKRPENGYKFHRRLGRVIHSCFEMSEGSNPAPKILNTNDLIMPILPARTEIEEYDPECRHTISLIGDYKDNSFLVKNIANAGGMRFDTSCSSRVAMCSGVQFYRACVTESEDSTTGETTSSVTWPDIPKHIEPESFNITVACIPVKEQHYKWCSETSSWNPVNGSGDSLSECTGPVLKSSLQIKAQSLCGSSWKIGWVSSGGVEIPVYDFFPTESKDYTAGRGINICEVNENIGTEEEPNEVKRYYICNTMKFCAGCGVTICEPTCAQFKIHAKMKKIVGGCGVCVVDEQCQYKISAKGACVKLTAGDGISVTGSGKCWKICNTRKETTISAGCGICVVQNGSNYKVSIKAPCSTCSTCICGVSYTFDPAWFTVTGNNVTLNETKINTVASTIAKNISSQITSTTSATIDTWSDDTGYRGYNGEIIADINTTSGCTATANIRSVSS